MEKILHLSIYWNPSPEITSWNLPFLNRPILWYGFFFALGFVLAYLTFRGLLLTFMSNYRVRKKEIFKIAERVSGYVLVGTILGARIGDVLFYQSPKEYVQDPFGIFRFWEGGLSSHGGVIGILLSIWVFCVKIRKKYPMLTWVAMLDLLSIPALLAGGFIRLGNFFNQEIAGKVTTLPWGVVFGRAADGLSNVARHPVQMYESLFYFAFFAVLFWLRTHIKKVYRLGKTSGLFFMGTFAFRFLVEFVKSPQSRILEPGSLLSMGQILSIPMILVGAILFFGEKKRLGARSVKRH